MSMLIYPVGSTEACGCAARALRAAGASLVDHPTPEVTHLLLDVPSFSGDGQLRGGGALQQVLERLPPSVTVIGGNLEHPDLSDHHTLDLLKDTQYLAENAAITAHCAMQVAARELPVTLGGCAVLIIGWGRIGKCLARLLKAVGAEVTVAARKTSDRAMLEALGYQAVDMASLQAPQLPYRLVFNTAPEPVMERRPGSCVYIELAFKPGILGSGVIEARGLPGIFAPESSGQLIAKTIFRRIGRD